MKLKDRDGHIVETSNEFVINQLLKYGAVEVKETTKPKETTKGAR